MPTPCIPGETLDAIEVLALVDSGDAWLLDVREDFEWADGRAPQAHHIPMGDLGLRQDELPDDGTTIAVICHIGGRSQMVVEALVRADYPAVNVGGGMVAWRASGGEVVASGDGSES